MDDVFSFKINSLGDMFTEEDLLSDGEYKQKDNETTLQKLQEDPEYGEGILIIDEVTFEDETASVLSDKQKKPYEKWEEYEVIALLAVQKWIRTKYPHKKYKNNQLLCQVCSKYLKKTHQDVRKIRLKLSYIKRTKEFDSQIFKLKIEQFILHNLQWTNKQNYNISQ